MYKRFFRGIIVIRLKSLSPLDFDILHQKKGGERDTNWPHSQNPPHFKWPKSQPVLSFYSTYNSHEVNGFRIVDVNPTHHQATRSSRWYGQMLFPLSCPKHVSYLRGCVQWVSRIHYHWCSTQISRTLRQKPLSLGERFLDAPIWPHRIQFNPGKFDRSVMARTPKAKGREMTFFCKSAISCNRMSTIVHFW